MPTNEELSARAHQLAADVKSLTQSAKDHCAEYKKLADKAYENLQAYLKAHGVTTVDEWLKICMKELTPEEAAAVQQTLANLEPPQGLSALVQPTEIAKFIAGWYIAKGAIPIFKVAALNAKAWFHNYVVINRLPVVDAGAVAGELEASSIASTTEELAEAAEFIEGDEAAVLIAGAEAEAGEIIAAEGVAAAEVATVGAAEVAGSWNVAFLAIGAVVLAGTYAYSKVKQSKDADKLKGIVAELSTARLYALVAEKSIIAQSDEGSILTYLNKALESKNADAQTYFKQQVAQTTPKIDVDSCYQQLVAQDKAMKAVTDADPSLQDMKQRHQQEVDKMREKAKKK